METFEGAYIEVVDGVVAFRSGLNGQILAMKNLADFVYEWQIDLYVDSMKCRKWWRHVAKRFEYESFSRFNNF